MRCAAQPSCCCAQHSFAAAVCTTHGWLINYMFNNVKKITAPAPTSPPAAGRRRPAQIRRLLRPPRRCRWARRWTAAVWAWLSAAGLPGSPPSTCGAPGVEPNMIGDAAMPSRQRGVGAQHSGVPPAPATLCRRRNGPIPLSSSPFQLTRWAQGSPAAPACTRTGPRCQMPSTWPAVQVGATAGGPTDIWLAGSSPTECTHAESVLQMQEKNLSGMLAALHIPGSRQGTGAGPCRVNALPPAPAPVQPLHGSSTQTQ